MATSSNPFVTADAEIIPAEIVTPTALEAIERAQIDQQIATAKRYPRPSMDKIRARILSLATIDKETAEKCFYTLKRDGKTIQGKSVVLARIAARCFGNLRIAGRVVGEEEKFILAQGLCLDLESNVGVSLDVRRRITRTDGRRYGDDMIATTSAAAVSIALRNAIFGVIDDALLKPVYDACRKVAVGQAKSLSDKFGEIATTFSKMGVEPARLVEWCEKPEESQLSWEDIMDLIGLQGALHSGETKLDDVFPPQAKKPTFLKKAEKVESGSPRQEEPERRSGEPTEEEMAREQAAQLKREAEADGLFPTEPANAATADPGRKRR